RLRRPRPAGATSPPSLWLWPTLVSSRTSPPPPPPPPQLLPRTRRAPLTVTYDSFCGPTRSMRRLKQITSLVNTVNPLARPLIHLVEAVLNTDPGCWVQDCLAEQPQLLGLSAERSYLFRFFSEKKKPPEANTTLRRCGMPCGRPSFLEKKQKHCPPSYDIV